MRQNLRQLVLAVVAALFSVGPVFADINIKKTHLVFCHEDKNAYPWVFPVKETNSVSGLDIEMMALLESELGIPIKLGAYPWKRCLQLMAAGQVDGAFAASFKTERLKMGSYPKLPSGAYDSHKRIHTSGYSLYRLKNSNIEWDGKQFKNLEGSIGVQAGFSIVEKLNKLKVITEETGGVERNLHKLLLKRVQAVALQTLRADYVLDTISQFKEKIEKYPIPISEKPYYLMLSFDMVKTHPLLSKAIWNKLAMLRESERYKEIVRKFWQKEKK